MGTTLKVSHLKDNTYQVIELYSDVDGECEDAGVLYQGSISECEAYIRLRNGDLLVWI